MPTEFLLIAVTILIAFAVFDLMVGVSNDAVNFLNSSIGSKVAPRHIILAVASLGILAGVTFSSGMMEVARKGIFHPQLFTMPELLMIFLAVMLTDIVLLDFFNTFGLPTSTTVSIVFELLGGAVALSIIKISLSGNEDALGDYINTAKALAIIFGILLSIIMSFFSGALAQFLTRLLFSFDYASRLKKFGAIWAGFAMAFIIYFILIKGAKGASFLTPETASAIKSNALSILGVTFAISTIVFQLCVFLKINILKPLILVGTFALAMAFAANDLVNFIGVPLAGLSAYKVGMASGSPLTELMSPLSEKVQTNTFLLILAGLIMVVTLWLSKKSRTVSETELSLGQQEEGVERFESVFLSRIIVRMWLNLFDVLKALVPRFLQVKLAARMDPHFTREAETESDTPRFDLMRAAVNLMVASGVISYATSQKLPLSTTYVTFMVSMGTSFADRAWGRESAVYRITGVLTVVGGWFMTALSAFILSFITVTVIYFTQFYAVPFILLLIAFFLWKTRLKHKELSQSQSADKIFNLKKIKDAPGSIATTFEHMAILIKESRQCLEVTLDALFLQDSGTLNVQKKKAKQIRSWTNIVIANIFKSMRLLQKTGHDVPLQYPKIISRLQTFSNCHADLVLSSTTHVNNQHKGLIPEQIEDLKKVKQLVHEIFIAVEEAFNKKSGINYKLAQERDSELIRLGEELNQKQVKRIVDRSSKTRLSILYYSVIEDTRRMAKQALRLLKLFDECFGNVEAVQSQNKP